MSAVYSSAGTVLPHRRHARLAAVADEVGMSGSDLIHRWDPIVEEASKRFDVPVEWIRAVMMRESGGRTNLVSHAGAVGLMQLMPGTYDGLRAQLGLGRDRFNPGDNIMAATCYLSSLNKKYGLAGMFAAYNAGPGTYEKSLAGRRLPAETQAYVQYVSRALGVDVTASTSPAPAPAAPPVTNTYVAATTAPTAGPQVATNTVTPVVPVGPPQPPAPPMVMASVNF